MTLSRSVLFRLGGILLAVAALATWAMTSPGHTQESFAELSPAKPGTRFAFEVIESFDAKYEGDTPGHIGRGGGLERIRPNVALGDAVYRGDEKVGEVTTVAWQRAQGALTVEFDPAAGVRVATGDAVWIYLNPEVRKP